MTESGFPLEFILRPAKRDRGAGMTLWEGKDYTVQDGDSMRFRFDT